MAARTVQGSPGQVAAASRYSVSIPAGMALLAAALGGPPPSAEFPPRLPPPAPTPPTDVLTTPIAAAMSTAADSSPAAPIAKARGTFIAEERSDPGHGQRAVAILGS
jgi:hypothetical protein